MRFKKHERVIRTLLAIIFRSIQTRYLNVIHEGHHEYIEELQREFTEELDKQIAIACEDIEYTQETLDYIKWIRDFHCEYIGEKIQERLICTQQ